MCLPKKIRKQVRRAVDGFADTLQVFPVQMPEILSSAMELLFHVYSFPDIKSQICGGKGNSILLHHCLFSSLLLSLPQPTAVIAKTSLLLRARPNQQPLRTAHQTWKLPLRPSVTDDPPLRAISIISRATLTTPNTETTMEDHHVCTSGASRCVSVTHWIHLLL